MSITESLVPFNRPPLRTTHSFFFRLKDGLLHRVYTLGANNIYSRQGNKQCAHIPAERAVHLNNK